MDESTMDSTADRYEILISAPVFSPGVLRNLSECLAHFFQCFFFFFLFFFPLREKLSTGSLAGVKTGLSRLKSLLIPDYIVYRFVMLLLLCLLI